MRKVAVPWDTRILVGSRDATLEAWMNRRIPPHHRQLGHGRATTDAVLLLYSGPAAILRDTDRSTFWSDLHLHGSKGRGCTLRKHWHSVLRLSLQVNLHIGESSQCRIVLKAKLNCLVHYLNPMTARQTIDCQFHLQISPGFSKR